MNLHENLIKTKSYPEKKKNREKEVKYCLWLRNKK